MNKTLLGIVIFLMLSTRAAYSQNTVMSDVAEKDYAGYLFVYFTGNKIEDETLHYAVSTDGYHFMSLNHNNPVMESKSITESGGIRDPHILRGEDGRTFYMVMTDMASSHGWDSNRGIVLMKSTDLVHWTSSIVNIQKKYSGQENLKRVWAPQTIYDKHAGKYMIYWSMKYGDQQDVIYYAYANKDFTDIEGEPKPLFVPENKMSCIDGDILIKDGIYHLFYKMTDAKSNGIKEAVTLNLTSEKWLEYPGYKEQTTDHVEGAGTFKLIGKDKYILMYDVFGKGRYEFTESQDLDSFAKVENVSMDFHPRHGAVMAVTRQELKRLTDKWGVPSGINLPSDSNPVLTGYFADPEVLYAEKTGKYYIYPTSDGFTGWSGTYFKAFSSPDLASWNDEGVILDLKKDVTWADHNAWAPCIIEKKKGKKFKYYFYYTAAQKVGVAVANDPAGPFVDSGKPLVADRPEGTKGGQVIDPDVFMDPQSKKSYLYYGNGYMAVAELNNDMVSIKPSTTKIITPSDHTFREGTYVFYRNGKYYFLWSQGDTRSPDYCVRYGISTSPTGPIDIPANNILLKKDADKGIYGTGHCSVVQAPGTDEWHIVYHRFSRPEGINMGRAAGYMREVCIDKLEFNVDGTLKEVIPTL